MKFLKQFFNDDSVIVGLCGFKGIKPAYNESPVFNENFFRSIEFKKSDISIFETDFEKNIFLL